MMDKWELLRVVVLTVGALFVIGTAVGDFLALKSHRRAALLVWLMATLGGFVFSCSLCPLVWSRSHSRFCSSVWQ
jgi:hypothetical protein